MERDLSINSSIDYRKGDENRIYMHIMRKRNKPKPVIKKGNKQEARKRARSMQREFQQFYYQALIYLKTMHVSVDLWWGK